MTDPKKTKDNRKNSHVIQTPENVERARVRSMGIQKYRCALCLEGEHCAGISNNAECSCQVCEPGLEEGE